MPKAGKKYLESAKLVEKDKLYDPEEAVELVKKTANAKFDQTIEIAVRLGVNPKHADQQVRGAVVLPSGTGKSQKVLVFAKGDKAREAEEAGADIVGAEDLVEKIQGGWTDFDVCIATPDMMGLVGPLGKVLGPRGLMPSPRAGTVTMDVAKTIKEYKAGKVEFRNDKAGIIHAVAGKISFEDQKLLENLEAFINYINSLKPMAVKGQYLKGITISATMSPGVRVAI